MDERDKKKLQKNLLLMVENLRVEDIKDHLYARDILTAEDMEALAIQTITPQEAVRRLIISILPKKGSNTFAVFIEVLRLPDMGYAYLADSLETCEVSVDRTDSAAAVTGYTDEDKIKQLQNQLWMQTELLLQYKREMDDLRAKVEVSELEVNKTNEKFTQIEQEMEQKAWNPDRILDYLNNYMKTNKKRPRSHPKDDKPWTSSSSMPSPPTVSTQTSPGMVPSSPPTPADEADAETFSKYQEGFKGRTATNLVTDSIDPWESDRDTGHIITSFPRLNSSESVAKTVGRDIVAYMIHGDALGDAVDEPQATMRKVVSEMTKNELFEKSITRLQMDEINGYDTVLHVADELIADGINWGRIVALYAFTGRVAKFFAVHGSQSQEHAAEMEDLLADFLGDYAARKLDDWIEKEGGWMSFVQRFGKPAAKEEDSLSLGNWKHLVTVIGLGALTTIVTFNRT